jgi:hypothetical protein
MVCLMSDMKDEAKAWLEREDNLAHSERLSRLQWMAENTPQPELLIFRGSLMSKSLFEEARYCFVYGQFLATIILSLAFIEHILAALFYEIGRSDLEKDGIAKLAKEALKTGWLSQEEYSWLEEIRDIRNPIVHFRHLGIQPDEQVKPNWWKSRIESRAIVQNQLPYELLEDDAKKAIKTVLHLLGTKLVSL